MGLVSLAGVATFFAPAGRASADELRRQQEIISNAPLMQPVMDAVSDGVLVLNGKRQVVGANRAMLTLLGAYLETIVGKRPGEIVGCIRAAEGPDGCGTAEHCMTCGAVGAILESQETNTQITRECRVVTDTSGGGAIDLSVTATAYTIGGEKFIICSVSDVSDKKRLRVLGRMFFHDILNTTGSIQGYAQMIAERIDDNSSTKHDAMRMANLANSLLEEIQSHRDLTYAESGDLEVHVEDIETLELVDDLRILYSGHPVASNRHIRLRDVWRGRITSDRRLLMRVLGNMVKNALEATDPGGTVYIDCVDLGTAVRFGVHNSSVMPAEVQLQVFQRSFSTKSPVGRGVGTHSMRLIGERYLGGSVSFSSTDPEGTTFNFTVSKEPE